MEYLLTRVFKASQGEELDAKKPRRSSRLSQRQDDPDKTPVSHKQQLPSPVTHFTTEDTSEFYKEATATPPEGRPSQVHHRDDFYTQTQGFSSPPQDTQAFPSQLVDPNAPLSDEVEDEVKEGVWGYLLPLDTKYGGRCVVLRKRAACPLPGTVSEAVSLNGRAKGKKALLKEEESFESDKASSGLPSGGYLIGRHPECGRWPCSLFFGWNSDLGSQTS